MIGLYPEELYTMEEEEEVVVVNDGEEQFDMAYLGFAALASLLMSAEESDFFLWQDADDVVKGTAEDKPIALEEEEDDLIEATYLGVAAVAKALVVAATTQDSFNKAVTPFFLFPDGNYDGAVSSRASSESDDDEDDVRYSGFKYVAEKYAAFVEDGSECSFIFPDALYDGPVSNKRKVVDIDDEMAPYLHFRAIALAQWNLAKGLIEATNYPLRALHFLASPFNSQREPVDSTTKKQKMKKALSHENLSNEDLASLAGTKLWGQKSKRSVRLRNHFL